MPRRLGRPPIYPDQEMHVVSLRLPTDIHEGVRAFAEANGISWAQAARALMASTVTATAGAGDRHLEIGDDVFKVAEDA